MPTLSVIVPVYNAERSIARCIDSILGQEFKDLELILIDDGSRDHSPAILDTYAEADGRVRVIHKENTGVSDTRNQALTLARGDYIQFLDADDWGTSDAAATLIHTARRTGADLVIADFYRVVGKNVSRKGSIESSDPLTLQEFAEHMKETPADYYYGVLWNKLYRRSIIETHQIRMDRRIRMAEDFIFNLEYYLHCQTIAPVQIPVYYYVKTEGSLVSQSMSLPKLVQMKRNVFSYYDRFYKNVLDPSTYTAQRLGIVRFFFEGARDDAVIPILPSTKKLGEENVPAFFSPSPEHDLLTLSYRLGKLTDRSLNRIAMKNDLELKDVKVFSGVLCQKEPSSPKELVDYTGFTHVTVIASLRKLASKGYVRLSMDVDNLNMRAFLGESEQVLREDIAEAMLALETRLLSGFDQAQLDQARLIARQISQNISKEMLI